MSGMKMGSASGGDKRSTVTSNNQGDSLGKDDRSNGSPSECTVGCFSRSTSVDGTNKKLPQVARTLSKADLDVIKSGRHCCGSGGGQLDSPDCRINWKCPDPGCKTNNHEGQRNCSGCKLPRHSANQFKRSQSKILKQL